MRFCSLGSGSKGNGTLVASPDTTLLIDCGFTRREVERRLRRRGLAPEALDAILVTHEHGDHSAGVAALSRSYGIPVYLTHGTAASGRLEGAGSLCLFNADDGFAIGDIQVQSVTVPHDAREPVQYRFQYQDVSLGVITDLGSVTSHVIDAFAGCAALLLEFNHELQLLEQGPYPKSLIRRVASDLGHLNNGQALALLEALDTSVLKHLVVAHISEQNNTREHVAATLARFATEAAVHYACQSDGFDWLTPMPDEMDLQAVSISA